MKHVELARKIKSSSHWTRLAAVSLLAVAALAGCGGGSDGAPGAPGVDGTSVDPTVLNDLTAKIDALTLAAIKPEQCSLCHAGTTPSAKSGPNHQAEYAKYIDASKFTLTIDSVVNVGADAVLTFTASNGTGTAVTATEVANYAQKTFYAVDYDSATRKFGGINASFSFATSKKVGTATVACPECFVPTGTAGQFKVTAAGKAVPATNAFAYGYIANGTLTTEGMTLYDDVASAALATGTASAADPNKYTSSANVSSCETCHGKPYMKHGYRAADVGGLPSFAACKTCHYDSRNGSHRDWQLLKDDPAAVAAGTVPSAAKYDYKAKLMNDVHMSHAMEFPYPQSMQSCVTCHEGHMGNTAENDIFKDSKFVVETCVSCHAVDGLKAKMIKRTSDGAAITIHDSFLTSLDTKVARDALAADYCSTCHKVGGVARSFANLHSSGYNPKIYSTAGDRYSKKIVVTTPTATIAPDKVLTITFTATGAVGTLSADKITPTVLVGLYGYDSKDFLVAAHGTNADGKRNLEYVWGGTAANNPTTRFTQVSKTTVAGTTTWVLTANLSAWATQIDAKKIRRAEIAVMPELKNGTTVLGLDAPSATFNLDGVTNDSAYFKDIVNVLKTAGTGATGTSAAQVNGCNSCHDQLATTFHSGTRGGNIKVCRICHEVSNAGSHLELQSRSIDSYIHSVHSFQAFDSGDINFDDPVERQEYAHHIASTFPRFTIQNCESCHVQSMYSVPDQAKSMPGVLSGTDAVAGRSIGAIPAAVTGPAVRACGGCHRAQVIKADDAGKLQVLISHWQTNGMYIYVTETAAVLWAAVVEKIMGFFG